ncbi:MAG: hypothetical protein AAGC92_05065 [Pseudomonadota bacterium]
MDFLQAPGSDRSTLEIAMAFVMDYPLISALGAGLCLVLICNALGIGGWSGRGGGDGGGGWGDGGDGGGGD